MPNQLAVDDSETHLGDELTSTQSSKRRHKINRACVACRNTKTKCIPSRQGDSCEACMNKSRPCVPSGPVKPRMKSSEKFSELEKRIESLTKALSSRHQTQTPPESGRSIISSEDLVQDSRTHPTNRVINQLPERGSRSTLPSLPNDLNNTLNSTTWTYVDVIDQGFIDFPTAEVLFNHYSISMHPILPIVNLSGDTDLNRFRTTKPMSLLAILAISSASILPSFEPRLVMELNEQLARHVFIIGTQSLDLIQAMLIYSQYYIRPSGSKNHTQTHLISSAVTMSHDLSIHRTARSTSPLGSRAEKERGRTWLTCWFAASINAVVLHQPCIVSATNGAETGLLGALEDSESSQSDLWLFRLFRLQRLVEDATTIYGPMTSKPIEGLDESNSALKLKMCQQRLEKWKATGTPAVDSRLNACAIHFAELVVHHIAMRNIVSRVYASYEAARSLPSATGFKPNLAPWQVEAIFRCLISSQALLDIYCSLEDPLARSLPNMYLVWTIFAGFSLVKLSYLAEAVSSTDSSIMTEMPSQRSTTDFLDAMVSKIEAVSRNGYMPQAKGFGFAFKKLRSYYVQKKHMCLHAGADCESSIDGQSAQIINPLGDGSGQSKTNASTQELGGSDWQRVEFDQSLDRHSGLHQVLPEPYSSTVTDISRGMLDASEIPIPAAYDPSTYAQTNWDDFVLDDVAMRELNDFMMEDDPAWMRAFL